MHIDMNDQCQRHYKKGMEKHVPKLVCSCSWVYLAGFRELVVVIRFEIKKKKKQIVKLMGYKAN